MHHKQKADDGKSKKTTPSTPSRTAHKITLTFESGVLAVIKSIIVMDGFVDLLKFGYGLLRQRRLLEMFVDGGFWRQGGGG